MDSRLFPPKQVWHFPGHKWITVNLLVFWWGSLILASFSHFFLKSHFMDSALRVRGTASYVVVQNGQLTACLIQWIMPIVIIATAIAITLYIARKSN